mmetsp:Transcript_37189/g.65492  ORF Transcript_37189/g.65492 Transcript_37189/m.65492 type:complete len:91 (-) Transcript_37189:61-333(-)
MNDNGMSKVQNTLAIQAIPSVKSDEKLKKISTGTRTVSQKTSRMLKRFQIVLTLDVGLRMGIHDLTLKILDFEVVPERDNTMFHPPFNLG